MIRAVYGLMGLGMCLLSAPALANLSLVNYNGFEVRQSGNTWAFSHEPPSSTALRGGTVLPNAAVSTSQRALVASKTLPYGKGLPVDVVAKIPAGNFAKALVAAGRFGTPIGAALTAVQIADYLKDLGIQDVRNTADGLTGKVKTDTSGGDFPDGNLYSLTHPIDGPWFSTMAEACQSSLSEPIFTIDTKDVLIVSSSPLCHITLERKQSAGHYLKVSHKSAYYSKRSKCSAGSYETPDGCQSSPGTRTIAEQEILDKIAHASGWPTSAAIAAQKAIGLGIPIQTEAPTVSGPGNILGEKVTSSESIKLNPGTNNPAAPGATNTDPGTKTTTKTETKNAQYSGSNVTISTTTNTVTNITNNVTNITMTEENKTEEKEDDEKQEDPPTDTPFKDIPELYKQKYPDGIGGVVNKKIDEIKATPLFSLPTMLAPSLPSSGSCPSWQLDLSLASWAGYGVQTIQAPCWVWDFGKVVIIISALLLARRLIFGG